MLSGVCLFFCFVYYARLFGCILSVFLEKSLFKKGRFYAIINDIMFKEGK